MKKIKKKSEIKEILKKDYYEKILEKDYDHYDENVYFCLYEIADRVTKVWQRRKKKRI